MEEENIFSWFIAATPLWVTKPESVDSSEEEMAEFNCEAGGVPKPSINWYVNGQPIEGRYHFTIVLPNHASCNECFHCQILLL